MNDPVFPLDADRLDALETEHVRLRGTHGSNAVCRTCDDRWPCPPSLLVKVARERDALRARLDAAEARVVATATALTAALNERDAALASPEGVERAIAIVKDSRRTHVEWIDYLARHGDDLRPHEEIAGDADHHREAVAHYDHVLAALSGASPEGVVTLDGEVREALVEADGLASLIVYRYPSRLPPDLIGQLDALWRKCRTLYERVPYRPEDTKGGD